MADQGFLPSKKRRAMEMEAGEAVDHKVQDGELKAALGTINVNNSCKFIINGFQPHPTSSTRSEDGPLQKLRKLNPAGGIFIINPSSTPTPSPSPAMQIETNKKGDNTIVNKPQEAPSSSSHGMDESSHHKKAHINQQQQHEEEESIQRSALYNQPYKKFPSINKKGWLEESWRMGVSRPILHTTKRVTRTDTVSDQNRFQLTETEIGNSMLELKKRSHEVAKMDSEDHGVAVKVMDKMGNLYDMSFKYLINSSKNYRFKGKGYREFLRRTELAPNQLMDVWGLPGLQGGYDDYCCFALINYDEERLIESMEADGEEEGGGGDQPLPPLPHWIVEC